MGVTEGLDDMRTALADVQDLSVVIDGGCVYVDGLFTEFENTFLPGVQCVLAVLFAIFVNNMLCCAEGCCKSPPTAVAAAQDQPPKFRKKNKPNHPQPYEKDVLQAV